jgi:RsiW-degrading membrane proteinase PrsW (M82 family)
VSPDPAPDHPPEDFLNQRSAGAGFGRVLAEIRALPFGTILPINAWIQDKPWDLRWVRWFAFFAFYPLILMRYFEDGISLTGAAWAFGLYFAAIWGLIFYFCLRPGPIKASVLLGTAGFTAVIGVSLLLAAQQLPVIKDFYSETDSANFIGRLFGFVCGVGLMEEATKALPLWWRFIHKKESVTPRECAFVGCASGLAFGVAEAVAYSIMYAVQQQRGELGYGDYLTVQFLRLITLPLLHALWAGTFGYYIGLAAAAPKRQLGLLVVGWVLVASLHGLYDTFSGSWVSTGVGMLSLLLFVGYARSADQIADNLRTA